MICKKIIKIIGFFIEIGYKMIICEQRRYNWNLFPIGKRFKDTPVNLSIQCWVTILGQEISVAMLVVMLYLKVSHSFLLLFRF